MVNKIIYNEGDRLTSIADPVWSPPGQGNTPITPTHIPCGYWSKNYVPSPTPAELPCNWDIVAPQYGADTVNRPTDLIVFNNEIFAASSSSGYTLLKWNEVDAWEGLIPYVAADACPALAILGTDLYGLGANINLNKWDGISAWGRKVTHSGYYSSNFLTSYNSRLYTHEGSAGTIKLLEWDGAASWVDKGSYSAADAESIDSLIVFNGSLYLNTQAGLLKWNGTDTLSKVADYITAGYCAVFNNELYMTSGVYLYKFSGSEWVLQSGTMEGSDGSRAIIDYFGHLLISGTTSGNTSLWLYEDNAFRIAATNDIDTINCLCVHNGRLYGSGDKVNNTDTGLLWRWSNIYA